MAKGRERSEETDSGEGLVAKKRAMHLFCQIFGMQERGHVTNTSNVQVILNTCGKHQRKHNLSPQPHNTQPQGP